MSNVDTVKEIYAAFGRGDVPAILDKLDDSIAWDSQSTVPEVPCLKPRRGRAEVADFFASLEPLEFLRFEPQAYFAEGDQVIGMVIVEVAYKPTGKKYSFPVHGHIWRFGPSGKIVDFAHVTDTHLWVRLIRGE